MKRGTTTMKRTAFKRASATPMKKRTRGLRPVSKKVQRGRAAFDAEYRTVDARSGGRCEVRVQLSYLGVPYATCPPDFPRTLCGERATDHHHTVKPRRSNHCAERVIHLCRRHHEQCESPFRSGRLVILPNGDGTFRSRYCYAKEEAMRWRAGR